MKCNVSKYLIATNSIQVWNLFFYLKDFILILQLFLSHLLMKNGAKRGQYIHIGGKRERLFQLAINTKIWGPDNDNDNVLVVRQCSAQKYIFTGFCLVLIQWLLYTKLSNYCRSAFINIASCFTRLWYSKGN